MSALSAPFAAVVDGDALLQVLWVSAAAGIGLSLVFSLAIASAARAGQQRRAGFAGQALAWSVVAGACGVLCGVAVAFGVIVMLSK
jgi:hypothetical protein